MAEKTLDQLVEERVQARLAELTRADTGLRAKLDELQREQNASLRALAASANQEPSGAYGTGRDFSRGRELAKQPGTRAAALAVAEDIKAQLRGTIYELED
jgi:hypothetical protein